MHKHALICVIFLNTRLIHISTFRYRSGNLLLHNKPCHYVVVQIIAIIYLSHKFEIWSWWKRLISGDAVSPDAVGSEAGRSAFEIAYSYGWQVGAGCSTGVLCGDLSSSPPELCMCCLGSSQHADWILKAIISRKLDKRYIVFSSLAS